MLAALRQDAPAAAPRLDYTDPAMREVLLATRQEGVLTFDGDLTGREVAPTSRDYPDAAYGWMGDQVGLGYQAAVVSLRSNSYGRILLASQRHPGERGCCRCAT
jgi:hypothetical protein